MICTVFLIGFPSFGIQINGIGSELSWSEIGRVAFFEKRQQRGIRDAQLERKIGDCEY
jgi:hypothetical protein